MSQPPTFPMPSDAPYGAPADPAEPVHHPEPVSYPLILRTNRYEWWQPFSGLLLFMVGFVMVPVVTIPLLLLTVSPAANQSRMDAALAAASLDPLTWQGMLFLNLALAGMIPLTWALLRFLHGLSPRWLASILPGIRWRFLGWCFGVALLAIAAQFVVSSFLPQTSVEYATTLNDPTRRLIELGIVVLLTTPLQAIGEEYGFRGYLLAAFGSWSRNPWLGIVGSALIFALAHGQQNWPLFVDRFAFGLMAAYLVYRTGGLEAGIALHVWNNLFAFGLALTIGDIDEILAITEVPWWNLAATITQNGVYLLLVLWVARRLGIRSVSAGRDHDGRSASGTPVLPGSGAPV